MTTGSRGTPQSPAAFSKTRGLSHVPVAPGKPKPSKSKFLRGALDRIITPQIKVGDGRVNPGSNATDLVYRTARNQQGGTDGTFEITARFAVEISDLVNQVSFTLQIDPAYVAGVSVRGIATDDSDLNSLSISGFALTDNGGGNYTFGPWTPSGTKTYYGFEVKLTPVDTTNDETLHDEYFVIQSMSIVQNGNDLLNSVEVLGSSTWAQQVYVAYPKAFSTQILSSSNGNDVFITGTQNISGSRYLWAYCSPGGSGDGSEFSPFSLVDARNLYNSGALSVLFLYGGTYTFAGQKPRDIFTPSTSSLVLCVDSESALFDTSNPLLFSGMSVVGSHYEIAYSETNHYNATIIGAGTGTPKIVLETLNQTMTEVSTAAEVDTTDFSFYWDNVGKKFLIRFDGVQTDDVHVCESGNMFYSESFEYLGALGVTMKGVQGAFANLDSGQFYEFYETGTVYGNAAGHIYDIDNVDGVQVNDKAYKSQLDGFNYHGYGHTELFDCDAKYCRDDGCSHHDECTGYVRGGTYNNNGKGGVIPAFGAKAVCDKVTAQNNDSGSSPLVNGDNFGGFVCLSNDADNTKTTLECFNCISDTNEHGYISSGGQSLLSVIEGSADNNTNGVYSATWGGNSQKGVIVDISVNYSGNTNDKVGEVRVMNL